MGACNVLCLARWRPFRDMPRKKTAPDTLNPFQRMFGAYLRLERTRLELSSRAVADRLHLTDTYLRLAESGRAALNQALIFKLIAVFGETNAPTHNSRTISFSRLALFMVGMHWVGAEMASFEGEANPGRRATERLAELVNEFEFFIQRTKRYFELADDSPEQKAFLEDVVAPELELFLRSDTYGRTDIESIEEDVLPRRELLELPTMNIGILLNLKDDLTGRSFVHTADVASKWESQRASQFRSVHGVYSQTDLIFSEDNLKRFKYEYLSAQRFESLQMIFLDGTSDEDELKTQFIDRLNKSRGSQNPKLALSTDEADRIHFLCPPKKRYQEFKTQLDQLLRRPPSEARSTKPRAYWSFRTHTGLHIGFVGNAADIRNLNLRDSVDSANLFRTVWAGLDESPKS